jgi:peptidoglycan/LPS O-acetylase OafA/YrhL
VTHSELEAFLGGFTIQSFVNSMWEQLLGISLMVALMAIGAHRWNNQSAWMKILARSAYAVYIIHPMVLVLVALLLKEVYVPGLFKFVVTGSLSLALSFAIGYILVKIPVINRVV